MATAPNVDQAIAQTVEAIYFCNAQLVTRPFWWRMSAEGEEVTRRKRELLDKLDELRTEARR